MTWTIPKMHSHIIGKVSRAQYFIPHIMIQTKTLTIQHYFLALQILISVKGPNDASVALTFQKVGMVQFRAGNLESGRLFLEKAVELYRQGGKGYESELITPLFIIGNIHNTLQQAEEAQRVWNDAFEMSNKIGEKTNPEVHHVLTQLLHVH